MKKYLVKLTSVATENNPNYRNQTNISYYGKDQELIYNEGNVMIKIARSDFMIREYGYDRLCDAKRSWIYKNSNGNNGYWMQSTEIIEVEV